MHKFEVYVCHCVIPPFRGIIYSSLRMLQLPCWIHTSEYEARLLSVWLQGSQCGFVFTFNICLLLVLSLFFYIVLTCRLNSMSQPLVKCKRVFQALIKLAVEELCETADSLIAPVRLGVARPTAPFTLASSTIDVINVSKSVTLCLLLWNFCYL